MSNTPSQAHLLPAEFHIWHFCPLSHSNLSFWLLSPRDISSVFFIAKLKEIPGIREMAVAYFFVETESPSSPQNPLCRCICPLSLLTVLAPFSHALGENLPRKPKLKDKLQKDTASLFFPLLFFLIKLLTYNYYFVYFLLPMKRIFVFPPHPLIPGYLAVRGPWPAIWVGSVLPRYLSDEALHMCPGGSGGETCGLLGTRQPHGRVWIFLVWGAMRDPQSVISSAGQGILPTAKY